MTQLGRYAIPPSGFRSGRSLDAACRQPAATGCAGARHDDAIRFSRFPSKGRCRKTRRRSSPVPDCAGEAAWRPATIAAPSGARHVEIAYLSASENASQLARGACISASPGEDLVRESIVDADKRVALIITSAFGSANVVVAYRRPGSMSAPWRSRRRHHRFSRAA